jgi:signal transduction histidine kinase
MNAVLGFAQMLQFDPKHPLSTIQNERVNNILDGGNYLLALINDVLELATIEAGRLDISIENVNANNVVADSVALMLPLASVQKITLTDTFSEDNPVHVKTDQRRFKQALLNLLANALKYNKDRGTVTINGHTTEQGYLRLSVTKLVVERMAGHIGFESKEGTGSTFWIELPLV